MTDALLAARFLAKEILEANAAEAERAGKPHVAASERQLIDCVDSGELDDGYTIDRLMKDWL